MLRAVATRRAAASPIWHTRLAALSSFTRREECATRLERELARPRRGRNKPLKTKKDGINIIHDPLWNKGMAMDCMHARAPTLASLSELA